MSSRSEGALVAVLGRRGRFLTAERAFPHPDRAAGAGTRSGQIVIGSARPDKGGRDARPGELVLVRAGAGRGGRRGRAGIVRVLGSPRVARDVIEALMLDRGLARGFSAAVEREARAAAERVRAERGEQRRDLRELATFTIDPASARDFDDAISAEAVGPGRTRVWVHIADVSAHVGEGSLVDREARRRATSVYVPGAVEPMLPHSLSSDACSLRPGEDRAALTAELELHGPRIERAAFYRSLVRSDERLDYERVDEIFAGRERARDPWAQPLQAARQAAAALQRRREQSGALVIDSEEPEFEFDEQGNVLAVHGRSQTESHRLIEHLMIAANEAVAALLAERRVPCLYRVHERPDGERVRLLVEQLASLEVPTPPVAERLSSTEAAALVGAISRMVEAHVARTGRGRLALGSLVLRALKQAYYSPRNLGHAGLQSSAYCHFTSPIRRYPDLVCHRALLSAVGGGESAPRPAELGELGVWTSEREREAMTIERDADDVARCFALEGALAGSDLERAFAGEVIGLIGAGAFIAFGDGDGDGAAPDEGSREPPFQGMLPVRMLRGPRPSAQRAGARGRQRGPQPVPGRASQRDGERSRGGGAQGEGGREWWELNEQGTILYGERSGAALRLGDPVEVAVSRIDTLRGRVDLLPAGGWAPRAGG